MTSSYNLRGCHEYFGTPQGKQKSGKSREFQLSPCVTKVAQHTPNILHCVQKTLFLLLERIFWRRRTLLYLVVLRKMPLGGFSKPPTGAQNGSPEPFSDPRGSPGESKPPGFSKIPTFTMCHQSGPTDPKYSPLRLLPERIFWRRLTLLCLDFLRKMPLDGFSNPPKGAQNGSPEPFSDPRGSPGG